MTKRQDVGPCQFYLRDLEPCGNPGMMHPKIGIILCGVCATVPWIVFRYAQPWDGANPENWA